MHCAVLNIKCVSSNFKIVEKIGFFYLHLIKIAQIIKHLSELLIMKIFFKMLESFIKRKLSFIIS